MLHHKCHSSNILSSFQLTFIAEMSQDPDKTVSDEEMVDEIRLVTIQLCIIQHCDKFRPPIGSGTGKESVRTHGPAVGGRGWQGARSGANVCRPSRLMRNSTSSLPRATPSLRPSPFILPTKTGCQRTLQMPPKYSTCLHVIPRALKMF